MPSPIVNRDARDLVGSLLVPIGDERGGVPDDFLRVTGRG